MRFWRHFSHTSLLFFFDKHSEIRQTWIITVCLSTFVCLIITHLDTSRFSAGSGGNTSPSHRTSLRDQDEQLQALKKENFNLKLRIYFLEDTASKMPNEGKEALCKQIVDLKVKYCMT